MRLFAFKDKKRWGKKICEEFRALGGKATLFYKAGEVPNEEDVVVFMYMFHYPIARREHNKHLMEELSKKDKILLIPSADEGRMYDNKILQYQTFGEWMPKTHYGTTRKEATSLAKEMVYPFISKASEGAGSSNIRFVTSKKQALSEINNVFTGDGLTLWIKNKQKDYVLWQEFLPGNSNDWRVILLAKKYALILKRDNRPNLPFASGSGRFTQITELSDEMIRLLDFTLSFVNEVDFLFTGVDIVYDGKHNPVILECTTGWGFDGYLNCRFFEHKDNKWIVTKYTGKQTFDVVAKAIRNKEF